MGRIQPSLLRRKAQTVAEHSLHETHALAGRWMQGGNTDAGFACGVLRGEIDGYCVV